MKTNLDLHRHAIEAAFKSLELGPNTEALAVQKSAHKAFEESGAHEADYEYWKNEFTRIRNDFVSKGTQPCQGERARIREEAAAKLKAAPANGEVK